MAHCLLPDGRCGRVGRPCRSGQCIARTVQRLHDRRWRAKLGLFVAEGEDVVDASRAAGVQPVELLVAGETVEPSLLSEVSSLGHPPRVAGVYARDALPRGTRELVLALWHVADPGNVGTLLRAADAFGASLALSPGCADLTGPKALRAAAGATFRVPTCPFDDAPAPRLALLAHGAPPLDGAIRERPLTLVLGAERDGVSPEVLDRCERQATIPLPGDAESLNVAMAGTLALYEATRAQ